MHCFPVAEFEEEDDNFFEDEDDDSGRPCLPGVWLPIFYDTMLSSEKPAFTAIAGPKDPPHPAAGPTEYVRKFLTDEFIQHLVEQTNLYAEQYVNSHQEHLASKPRSRVHKWIKQGGTYPDEMRAFLGIIVNMGLVVKPDMHSYWDTSQPSQDTPWFREHMNRDRFLLLLKFFHVNDNSRIPPVGDPTRVLYKIRPALDHFNLVFQEQFHPGKHISIDESLVGFRGKTPNLRQYLPNKRHARFGIKSNCVVDARTGYQVHSEIYKGARTETQIHGHPPEGATHALVMRLMTNAGLLNLGHHLTTDNFFTSPALMQDLFRNGTTATGTVRQNRRGLPKIALKAELRNMEVIERQKGPMLCTVFQDGRRRPVLISTEAEPGREAVTTRRGKHPQHNTTNISIYLLQQEQ
jgi:hypothetical protein